MENALREKLKNIKAVAFDADGVLFTGRVLVSQETGEMLKERSHIDGQGISLLRAIGMKIAFVTGEKSKFLEKVVDKLNNLPTVVDGKWEKVAMFTGQQGKKKVESIDIWLKEKGITWTECAAMGDDLADLQLLQAAGVAVAPAQAEDIIKKVAQYITKREGGNGAIRDLCNAILEAKNLDQTNLDLR